MGYRTKGTDSSRVYCVLNYRRELRSPPESGRNVQAYVKLIGYRNYTELLGTRRRYCVCEPRLPKT